MSAASFSISSIGENRTCVVPSIAQNFALKSRSRSEPSRKAKRCRKIQLPGSGDIVLKEIHRINPLSTEKLPQSQGFMPFILGHSHQSLMPKRAQLIAAISYAHSRASVLAHFLYDLESRGLSLYLKFL